MKKVEQHEIDLVDPKAWLKIAHDGALDVRLSEGSDDHVDHVRFVVRVCGEYNPGRAGSFIREAMLGALIKDYAYDHRTYCSVETSNDVAVGEMLRNLLLIVLGLEDKTVIPVREIKELREQLQTIKAKVSV